MPGALCLLESGTVLPESERQNGPRTIEALFAIVERVLNLGPSVARVKVIYDPSYGRSVINARTISYALLAGSACRLLYAVFIGQGLASWLVFLSGAAIILSFGLQILRVRREQRQFALSQSLTPVIQVALGVVGAACVILFVVTLWSVIPSKTPSGVAVSSYNAEASAGVCRFTYNQAEVVVRPMSECQAFQKTVSLIFGGGFLLFSVAGVWLAHLETGLEERHLHKI